MRTETITRNIYTFDELSPEAKERAIEKHRDFLAQDPFFWFGEALEAIKQGLDAFGATLGNSYHIQWDSTAQSYIPIGTPGDIEELTGQRLATWIHNNAYGALRERKQYRTGAKVRSSRIQYTDTCCPFAGVCYDESFLEPIRDFMKSPDSRTYAELMEEAAYNVIRDTESEIEYQLSDAGVIESIQANDYEFYENGELI